MFYTAHIKSSVVLYRDLITGRQSKQKDTGRRTGHDKYRRNEEVDKLTREEANIALTNPKLVRDVAKMKIMVSIN